MKTHYYGYARVSTAKQNIDRQISSIEDYASKNGIDAKEIKIYQESYTGRQVEGRAEFNKLLRRVKPHDTIIFDEVSRMSRNAEEGFKLYQELFNKGIELVFLKEPHINTDTYKEQLSKQINATFNTNDNAADELLNTIISALNTYMMSLAKKQIELAFNQAQKEVDMLSYRTKKGIKEAHDKGHLSGHKVGTKLTTKKSIEAKKIIRKHNIDFGGSLSNEETIRMCGISRNSFFKYKKELALELNEKNT